MSITVSLVILTWNRKESVGKSLSSNLETAKFPIREIIHVDNGSECGFADWFRETFNPAVQVRHAHNLGVAVGYNRGLLLSTSSHIVITGCDRVMPDEWLKTWAEHIEAIPETGVIACYSTPHEERMRGGPAVHKGKRIQRAIGVEARIHSRQFLMDTGLWREDFGLYGYEDSEWSDRAERVAKEQGLINYVIDGMRSTHLSDTDFYSALEIDGKVVPYHEYKRALHAQGADLFRKCHELGSPYYHPYARIEPNLRGE